jgi:hypothetical protein
VLACDPAADDGVSPVASAQSNTDGFTTIFSFVLTMALAFAVLSLPLSLFIIKVSGAVCLGRCGP